MAGGARVRSSATLIYTCFIHLWLKMLKHMGLSENNVPLNPMVNHHYPYYINGYNWEYTLFSDKPISQPKSHRTWLPAVLLVFLGFAALLLGAQIFPGLDHLSHDAPHRPGLRSRDSRGAPRDRRWPSHRALEPSLQRASAVSTEWQWGSGILQFVAIKNTWDLIQILSKWLWKNMTYRKISSR